MNGRADCLRYESSNGLTRDTAGLRLLFSQLKLELELPRGTVGYRFVDDFCSLFLKQICSYSCRRRGWYARRAGRWLGAASKNSPLGIMQEDCFPFFCLICSRQAISLLHLRRLTRSNSKLFATLQLCKIAQSQSLSETFCGSFHILCGGL